MSQVTQPPLFVFGSLRHGEQGHHVLAGRYARRLNATLHDFEMRMANHGYPVIFREPDCTVDGELFFLDAACYEQVLAACDAYERIPAGETLGELYRRLAVTVSTPEGPYTAWAYVAPETCDE